MQNKKFAILSVTFFALASCSVSSEKSYPPAIDYCADENRKIPPLEKKAIVLERMYSFSGNPNYIAEYIENDIGKSSSKAERIRSISNFILLNPLCCQLLNPDHLGNQIFNSRTLYDNYNRDFKWGYTSDIFIFGKAPSKQKYYKINGSFREKDLKAGGALMLNNCAEAKGFFRG